MYVSGRDAMKQMMDANDRTSEDVLAERRQQRTHENLAFVHLYSSFLSEVDSHVGFLALRTLEGNELGIHELFDRERSIARGPAIDESLDYPTVIYEPRRTQVQLDGSETQSHKSLH